MAGIKNRNTAEWIVSEAADPVASGAVASGLGVSGAMGRLLYKRGCKTPEEARAFITMESGSLHDPFLLPDMKEAVRKISEAVAGHKKIVIYGDYDADGVTSVSVLYLYLSGLRADVGYYIPRRAEGYGMSCDAVLRLKDEGVELIITVDTGITAAKEIKYARELGIDVVVTDHHECIDELPPACAVVNPQRADSEYPFSGLAGVGVTYKLVCALESDIRGGNIAAATLDISERFMDLVAIGTVADVMPVTGENRLIVSYGLRRIAKTTRPGLRALIEASTSGDGASKGKKTRFTTGFISFTLAPRINAAGRMGDASLAAELFLSCDDAKAAALAERLCEVNRERQRLENTVAEEAIAKIEATHDFERDPVIVVADDNWHSGIIGIVASRVTEKYGRPSILITFENPAGDNTVGKGSGRSVRGLNLAFALSRCGDCLMKYGGHELAAGLTLASSELDRFRTMINDIAREELSGTDETLTVEADDILAPDEITLGLAEEIRMLEPYGAGNPTPLFITEKMPVLGAVGVGAGRHTRLTLDAGGSATAAMYFSVSPAELGIRPGDMVDVMYNLEINEFRGNKTAQLIVRAIRKSAAEVGGEDDDEIHRLYISLRSGAAVGEYDKYIPERAEMAAIYRALRREICAGRCVFPLREAAALSGGLDPVKVRLSLDIFSELDILRTSESERGVFTIGLPPGSGKTDLDRSEILSMLRSKYKR